MDMIEINGDDGRLAYTLAECARMLGYSYGHFCRMVKAGVIKATHVGKGSRIMKADLQAFINKGR